jgi:hypothetical protein
MREGVDHPRNHDDGACVMVFYNLVGLKRVYILGLIYPLLPKSFQGAITQTRINVEELFMT